MAGQTGWRLPDIKQPYSLIDFSRTDPSSYSGSDTSDREKLAAFGLRPTLVLECIDGLLTVSPTGDSIS